MSGLNISNLKAQIEQAENEAVEAANFPALDTDAAENRSRIQKLTNKKEQIEHEISELRRGLNLIRETKLKAAVELFNNGVTPKKITDASNFDLAAIKKAAEELSAEDPIATPEDAPSGYGELS